MALYSDAGIPDAARATECLRQIAYKSTSALQRMHRATARAMEAMPRQSVAFRGGADSQKSYRAICRYLLPMERTKRELQELTVLAAELRTDLARAFAELSTRLLTEEAGDARLERERLLQRELLELLDSYLDATRVFDTSVLRRYLQALGEACDFAHEGERCNTERAIALCGAFCEQTDRLIGQIKAMPI